MAMRWQRENKKCVKMRVHHYVNVCVCLSECVCVRERARGNMCVCVIEAMIKTKAIEPSKVEQRRGRRKSFFFLPPRSRSLPGMENGGTQKMEGGPLSSEAAKAIVPEMIL
jgi:hypothetical protein